MRVKAPASDMGKPSTLDLSNDNKNYPPLLSLDLSNDNKGENFDLSNDEKGDNFECDPKCDVIGAKVIN